MIHRPSWTLWQYLSVYDEFCESIRDDPELMGHLDQRLRRLKEIGNQAREPISKYVQGGILECRAKSARHQARLLYCFHQERRIVILLGVLKDQRKLDKADIAEALKRKAIIEASAEFLSGIHQTH